MNTWINIVIHLWALAEFNKSLNDITQQRSSMAGRGESWEWGGGRGGVEKGNTVAPRSLRQFAYPTLGKYALFIAMLSRALCS